MQDSLGRRHYVTGHGARLVKQVGDPVFGFKAAPKETVVPAHVLSLDVQLQVRGFGTETQTGTLYTNALALSIFRLTLLQLMMLAAKMWVEW